MVAPPAEYCRWPAHIGTWRRKTTHNPVLHIISAEGNAAQGAFGRIVRETDTPIVEEEGEGRPAFQQVIESA